MRGIFIQDSGRLKTGRVSLLLFLGLVLGLGLLFHLHEPVDKAVVVVRHIFTATPEVESKKPPHKEPEKPTPQQEPVKLADKSPTEEIQKIKEKSRKLSEIPTPAQPSQVKSKLEKTVKNQPEELLTTKVTAPKPLPEPSTKIATDQTEAGVSEVATKVPKTVAGVKAETEMASTAAPVSEKPIPIDKKEALPSYKSLTKSADERNQIEENRENMSAQVKIEPEELVVDYQLSWQESVEPKETAISLMSETARQRLQDDLSRQGSSEASKESIKFNDVSLISNKRTAPEKKSGKRVERAGLSIVTALASINKQIETQSITVEKQEYRALHQAWRAVGEGEKESNRIIPLQIENLRSAYSFLQMKAVVILADNNCIDLHDGSRIPAASLDRFSSTVMRVDDPWQKWEVELRRAGLRPGQDFEVRYYLYDFVRRSIYARVNQAYSWIIERGLLKADTRPADVDVLGRAYVVKRSGGGSFGVFVPLSLTTRDGRIIDVDPLCLTDAPDITALHAAGII